MSYLKDHKQNRSIIRLQLLASIGFTGWGFLTACAVLLIQAVHDKEVNWYGAAAFVAALGGFMWQSGKNKVDQKKLELEQDKKS